METKQLDWFEMEDRAHKHFESCPRIKDGVAMGAAIGDFLNGCDEQDIADMLQYLTQMEHRTIQQEYMGLVLKSIKAFAEVPDNRTDARNAIAVRKAREISNYMDESYISAAMPCI